MQAGELVPALLLPGVDLVLGDHAVLDQRLRVEVRDALVALDLRVHLRLRVRRLVGLVVAEAPVADQVDQHVVAELGAEGHRQPDRGDAGLDVVGVDVDDRDVEALGEVRCPGRRARVLEVGREADLVVLHEVQRAADLVAVEALEVQRLRDHALPGEGRVAVQHDRHRGVLVALGARPAAVGLRGARGAHHDRVDELQMARVGLQVDEDLAALAQLVGARVAVVVLDVAGAALRDLGDGLDDLERRGALELAEDRLVGAAEVVGEHVQAAAMRHPDDDLARAVGCAELDHLVDHRDRHVEALDRELLLTEVGLVQEALQRVDRDQAAQQAALLLGRHRRAVDAGLDPLAQPDALAMARDVLDLVGDDAAVGLAQVRQRLFEVLPRNVGAQDLRRDAAHQLRRQVDGVGVQRRVAHRVLPERVERRREVAVGAEGLDQRGRGLHGLQQLGDVLLRRDRDLRARRARRRRPGPGPAGARAPGPAAAPSDAKTAS